MTWLILPSVASMLCNRNGKKNNWQNGIDFRVHLLTAKEGMKLVLPVTSTARAAQTTTLSTATILPAQRSAVALCRH